MFFQRSHFYTPLLRPFYPICLFAAWLDFFYSITGRGFKITRSITVCIKAIQLQAIKPPTPANVVA